MKSIFQIIYLKEFQDQYCHLIFGKTKNNCVWAGPTPRHLLYTLRFHYSAAFVFIISLILCSPNASHA